MNNQDSSTLSTSNFPKVIAFLQPPYEHSNDCLAVKKDIAELCQKKNFNLIAAIDFKDPCNDQALNRLVDLVKYYASNRPITLMINEEMVATPNNILFWSVIGTLARMKLITVTAYDYDYIEHSGMFLDESGLGQLDFLNAASVYFDKHYLSSQNRAKKICADKLAQKSILFLQPPYNDGSHELKEKLKAYCKNKNYGKLKTIKYKSPRDINSFYALMRSISFCKAKPVRILVEQDTVHKPMHRILWIILDTLWTEELIEIYVYVQENGVLYLRQIKKSEYRLLSYAINCDKEELNSKPSVQETDRYHNWEEVKDSEADNDTVE